MKVTRKKFFLMIEGGPLLAHGSYQTYLYLKSGFFTWINPDKLSLTFITGAGVPLKGSPWKAIIMAELLGNVHFGKFYIGAGPGFSSKEQSTRKNGVDAVGQVGYTICHNYLKMSQIFFEFRAPIGRSFEDHHKMALGFRYNF
jgi:hypothetical protein